VRHRPYAVILFDEIEKAHPEVFNILLQVLDNGRLTDAKGRTVNFKNTVIILTSNIGAEFIDKFSKLGFSGSAITDAEKYDETRQKVTDALKDYFRPEFLNRLDEIIIFNILSSAAIQNIVKIQIGLVTERLKDKDISIVVSDDALAFLAKEGYNPQYGARPLKRLIQSALLTPIANMMVSRGVMEGGEVRVGIRTDEAGKTEFTFDVRKRAEQDRSIRSRIASVVK
jgi:ATP-dependent Clp protease ATP-binding subunit ClpC